MNKELQLGKYEFFPYDFVYKDVTADEISKIFSKLLKDLEKSKILTNRS
ncbi:MAG: hypothetical protein M3405_07755 [Acidobacteriota bacterium]|jgi:hypothetical protein|nr:hypothetical protein [Acidobacteriota bacterium]